MNSGEQKPCHRMWCLVHATGKCTRKRPENYIVMDYIDGRGLDQIIKPSLGSIPAEQSLHLNNRCRSPLPTDECVPITP